MMCIVVVGFSVFHRVSILFLNNIKKSITDHIQTDLRKNFLKFFCFILVLTENSSVVSASGGYWRQLLSLLHPSVSATYDKKLIGKAVNVCYRQDALVGDKINNGNKKAVGKSAKNCAHCWPAVVTDEKPTDGSFFISVPSLTGLYWRIIKAKIVVL